jgi:hypothetical protein
MWLCSTLQTCLLSVAVCLQEMAVLSSTTACAPITSHTTTPGSVPNIATCVIDQATVNTGSATGQQTPAHDKPANRLAEKLHGLTEKLHSLGHYRTDSDTSTRTRTGRKIWEVVMAQMVKKLPASCGTRRFVNAVASESVTTECHRTYRAVNTLRLCYKNQSVSAVQWNNLWSIKHEIQPLTVSGLNVPRSKHTPSLL